MNTNKKIIMIALTILCGGQTFADNGSIIEICKYLSNDKEKCLDDLNYIDKKMDTNSIVKICLNKKDQLENFKDCLLYEQNPLIFFKYQINRDISSIKMMSMQDKIGDYCSNKKTDKIQCYETIYENIQKGRDKNNWIENYCLFSESSLRKFDNCIVRIKNEAIHDNLLKNRIPELINSLDTVIEKMKKKDKKIKDVILKKCMSTYTDSNVMDCYDHKIQNLGFEKSTTIKSLYCYPNDTTESYLNCLKNN